MLLFNTSYTHFAQVQFLVYQRTGSFFNSFLRVLFGIVFIGGVKVPFIRSFLARVCSNADLSYVLYFHVFIRILIQYLITAVLCAITHAPIKSSTRTYCRTQNSVLWAP